jgi:hypothetical protein
MYEKFDEGHTFCAREAVEAALTRLVGKPHVSSAIALAQAHHYRADYLRIRVHALGPYLIEKTVADALQTAAGSGRCSSLAGVEVEAFLNQFEQEEAASVGDPYFALNDAQREAVHLVARRPLMLITGGAGSRQDYGVEVS